MKINKQKVCRIIALLMVVLQVLTMSPMEVFAKNSKIKESNGNVVNDIIKITQNKNNQNSSNKGKTKRQLKADIKNNKKSKNEKIRIEYDKSDIKKYRYETEGIEVENISDMKFDIVAKDKFGSLDIYADYGENEEIKSSIYTYIDDDGTVYVSDISKDLAWYDCVREKYASGNITQEEIESQYSDMLREDIEEIVIEENETFNSAISVMSLNSNTAAATGMLKWQTETGNTLPLKQTKIELRSKSAVGISTVLATGYTDDNGNFNLSYDKTEAYNNKVFIRAYAESKTFRVSLQLAAGRYYIDSVEVNVGESFSQYIKYNETKSTTKAMYLQQCMVVAQNFAYEMGMRTDNFINVIYPIPIVQNTGFCWGDIATNCYAAISENEFNDIDTITHEYGHFVECSMGNYGSNLLDMRLNRGPTHESDTDHFEDKPYKYYAMDLTWSEAWATAFAQIAQKYYVSEYPGIQGFADVVDGRDYELYKLNDASGEAQEDAVTMFLWDLFDDNNESFDDNNESSDKMSLGYYSWWSYTTKKGTYTLTDFVKVVDNYYPLSRSAIGELLGAHQISPSNVTITNLSSISKTTPPTISWKVNGSEANPNNRFEVVFYDKNGNHIYTAPYIDSTKANYETINYRVPQYVWNEVVRDYGGLYKITIEVRAYHTEGPISGPYMSKNVTITLNDGKRVLSINAANRYTENVVKLDAGAECEYEVTFATAGYKIIQTFGTLDTVVELYSSTGAILARSDTGGYSTNGFVRYYVQANTKYKIKVKFARSTTYGKTKLTVLAATMSYNSSASSIKSYSDILNISYAQYTITTTLQKNYVKVFTYTPTVSGNYTFEIKGDIDTYMYIIDPRNSNAITSGDYDDDSGEGMNPKITKYLTANVPYLIIYSSYNLTTTPESEYIKVTIKKTF